MCQPPRAVVQSLEYCAEWGRLDWRGWITQAVNPCMGTEYSQQELLLSPSARSERIA